MLGMLESPEVDQQVAAAAADLADQAAHVRALPQLVAKDFVSRQDFDTVRAQYEVAQATLRASPRAAAYKMLRAPFDGT